MPRKTEITGYHIEVRPTLSHNVHDPVKRMKEDCGEMVSAIKRHIDNVDSVEIIQDEKSVCEFCGARWSEDSHRFNGGCCKRDCEFEEVKG